VRKGSRRAGPWGRESERGGALAGLPACDPRRGEEGRDGAEDGGEESARRRARGGGGVAEAGREGRREERWRRRARVGR
jgi:hypothetical protein